MTRSFRTILSTASLLALAAPAVAEITADDVWQNLEAALGAMGGLSYAELEREGSVVSVLDHTVRFDLPLGAGHVWAEIGDYSMIEAEGAVSIVYPDVMQMTFGAEITGEGSGQATIQLAAEGYTTTATGDPGAISYLSRADQMTMDLLSVSADGMGEFDITGNVVMEGFKSESRIVEDSLIVFYTRTETGESTTSFEFSDGQGLYSESFTRAGPSISTGNMGLIPGGANLLNLSDALRNGMYINLEATGGESENHSLTRIDGLMEQEQSYATEGSDMALRLDRDALDMSGMTRGIVFNMTSDAPDVPSFGFDADALGLAFQTPLLASDAPQPFGFGLSLDNLRIGPSIWALLDPDKVLPRGPATLEMDVGGELILGADLPDIFAIAELGGSENFPFEVTTIDIARFAFSALGITADSEGRFELDYEDYSVIPGVPWPRGSGRAEVEGLNGAIDRFVELGLIDSEEVFGLRMILSLGTIVSGNDKLTSEIEFTEDGRIIANGQQLR